MVTKSSAATAQSSSATRNLILIVDDDPGIVGFLQLALSDEGYGVGTAANGREALVKIGERRPDLILLDMNMPVMDGWEFCERLRERGPAQGGIPIIVMTAARDASKRSREVGAQGYLGKPFDLDQLFQIVASLLPAQ
jgi:two-component system chemotaxis response regulator CheY